MHPSSLRAFQRDQEHDMKHPGSVDLISTNKTKQTNFNEEIIQYLRTFTPQVQTP
jgi:hypothetical protein